MKFKHFITLFLAVIAVACSKPETPEEKPAPEPEVEGMVTFTSSPLEAAVSASGGTVSISFTTNMEWTAGTDADWLHLSATSGGKGDSTITLTADKNENTDGRSATVSVSCGTDTKRVTVNQLQKDVLVLNGSDITVKAEGETVNLTLSANVEVTAQADVDWITVAETKGLTDCTFAITVNANETYDARTGHVTFSSVAGNGSITIDQVQKDAMILAPQTIEVKAEGGELELIKLQTNVEVVATPDVDWLSVEEVVETKGLVELTYLITVAANEVTEARTGHVVFASDAGRQTITVNQAAAVEPEVPEDPIGPYDTDLPLISATTTWAGSFFTDIIAANAASGATEWTSPDGKNFINNGLGFFAGSTTDTETGAVTYGKFKFKEAETAVAKEKMSRVQFGGTGVLGKRNLMQFKVNGGGALTVLAKSSSSSEARRLNVAVNEVPISEEGYEVPISGSDAVTISVKVEAADSDVISLYSMGSNINVYSIKWVPGGEPENPQDPEDPENPEGGSKVWDFSQEAWQSLFKELGEAAADLPAVSLNYDGMVINADAKSKYNTTYFQPAGVGSTEKNYFKFEVASDGVVTVVESHTGSSAPDPVRNIVVYNGGSETSIAGSINSKEVKECKYNVVAGDVYVYGTGSARYYKIAYTAGGNVTPGDPSDPEDPQPPGDNADLECPNPPEEGVVDIATLMGYAKDVTGGSKADPSHILHFNNGKALQTWLLQRTKDEKKGDHSAVTIWLSGTFKPDDGRDFSEAHPWFDVKDVSNLSFIGTDSFVMDRIGIFCVRANNIIIRNINFKQPKANNGADAVSLQECDGVWVDHCTFESLNQTKDYEDGSTDITHGSKNVTVSWCRYIKTQKSCLVGHSNSQSGDAQITATFHHNWFEGSSSRHPRVRFGKVHVFNNLFDGNTTYGVGSAYGAKVLVEYNYFDAVQLPTDICTYPAKESGQSNLQGSVAGYLYPTQNVYVNRPAKAKDPYPLSNVKYTSYNGSTITPLTYADFQPSYVYSVLPAADVPEVVKAGAGYGKLGFTSAPVDVNNGGINEYNGTDDDPVDPDPGTGDDPGDEPGDDPGDEPGTPGTHTLYVGADKKIVDDTYFTHSESIADFSKDYSGSFTIAGTEYKYGLKMDSKGSVVFTTSSTLTTTVQFYFARRKADGTAKMQIIPDGGTAQEFDTPHDSYADSGVLTLEKGTTYTIKQKSGEQALILVKVTETE